MTSSSAKVIMTRSDRTWSIWCGFRLATFCTWLEVSALILKEVIAKNMILTFFLTFDLDSSKVIGFRPTGGFITCPSLVKIEWTVSEKNALQTRKKENKKTRKWKVVWGQTKTCENKTMTMSHDHDIPWQTGQLQNKITNDDKMTMTMKRLPDFEIVYLLDQMTKSVTVNFKRPLRHNYWSNIDATFGMWHTEPRPNTIK